VLPNVLAMLFQGGGPPGTVAQSHVGRRVGASSLGRAHRSACNAIGEEESGEEGAVEEVLPPKRLLDEIHRFRGANLLLLAFVVPS